MDLLCQWGLLDDIQTEEEAIKVDGKIELATSLEEEEEEEEEE